jgi:LPXTG-motif cell wall-anchored protein
MSRATLPKAGVALVLAAFVIGITAANALAWPNEQPPAPAHEDKGKDNKHKGDKDEGEDEEEGKGKKEKPQPQPQVPTQPAGQPPPPAAVTTPPPPAPVVSQGAPPPAPEQPVTEQLPPEQGRVPESPVVAQAPPQAGAPSVPVAERQELAKTGLDPALIALLGALCLGGGGLLFRRALVRR